MKAANKSKFHAFLVAKTKAASKYCVPAGYYHFMTCRMAMLSAQLMAQGSMMWSSSSLLAQLQGASTRGRWLILPQVDPLAL